MNSYASTAGWTILVLILITIMVVYRPLQLKEQALGVPLKMQLAICQRKAFTTSEGIIAAPYGMKHKGVPDNLWILDMFDEDLKLVEANSNHRSTDTLKKERGNNDNN